MSRKKYGEAFQKWKETESGQQEIQAYREHENYFKLKLAPENLPNITKADITFKQVSNLQKYKQGQESVNGLTMILGEEDNNEINRVEVEILRNAPYQEKYIHYIKIT